MSSRMLFNTVFKMSTTRPIDRAPQLWCATLWVLTANQQTGIKIATLRMANILDVAIISSDDSIMKRFFQRMWLLPQISSRSSKNSIFGTQFLNIAMEPIQIKYFLLPEKRFCVHQVFLRVLLDHPCIEALTMPCWIIHSEVELFVIGPYQLRQIWVDMKETADSFKTIFKICGEECGHSLGSTIKPNTVEVLDTV